MTWHPISSAPMDGRTYVLLYKKDRFMVVGLYKENLNKGTPKAGSGWTDFSVDSFGWQTFTKLEPTHWQPLPAPPEDAA
jgi:hypothetical protein